MTEVKQLPTRAELPKELTWDLTKIFPSDEAFEEAYQNLAAELKNAAELKGTLGQSGQSLLNGIDYLLNVYRKLEVIYIYAHQKNDQDTTDTTYQALYARASSLLAQTSEALSWFNPEILALSDKEIKDLFAEEPKLTEYQHFIDTITSERPHVLSEKEEALLAAAGEIFDSGSNTFSILNNADLKFPVIEGSDGEKIQLSHGVYGQLMESTDRKVREAAFKGLYGVYEQFQNTFASTLGSHVKTHNYNARVRSYQSAREAALSRNQIPESVYESLIEVVHKNQPLLHRYVDLRKRMLQVDQLHMYDMYTPVLGEAPIKYNYAEAQEIALKALEPLGEEYLAIVKEAFTDRWIDVLENRGKRSGAYSSGCYDTPPYILLNWHDSLDQLFTLVHEMGHSVHSYLTRHNQPYAYGDYSIFLAEIASTTNENLLTEYLLKTETDPKVRAYIINHYLDGFKGTVFRQTQFAEFEWLIHQADEQGTPLTSEFLKEEYARINREYYGPTVEEDPEIHLEWSRIPHFYYNFYVYQYATGFSAASALAGNILQNGQPALTDYLTYLKAGSSAYPIDVMKRAGVDMTKSDYLEAAMNIFATRLTELEQCLKD